MTLPRSIFKFAIALLFLVPGVFACAQAYTSIVVIGDSLTDTGNDATVSGNKYGPAAQVPAPITGYTLGRFTDGADTSPMAQKYFGNWIEQVAALLAAKPKVLNSLAGGTNYAYGFATTNTGTSNFTYGPGMVLSFTVNNMGQQLSDYLATHPTITNKTLFVVWGGANDLILAQTSQDIANAAQREAGIVQALINAGATDFVVPNLPPLGLVPRFNGSTATSVPVNAAASGFDQYLAAYLAALPAQNPGKTLHIYPLDTYTLFNTIVAAPSLRGFANVTASSQGNTAINPDTYLFWDDLHPTTYGHSMIAASALTLLGTPVVTTTTLASSNSNANLNASVTLTASVAGTSGTPQGTVTFSDGTTVLGSSLVLGNNTTAAATYTTSSLTAGTHSISASFAGVNGYASSATTAAYNQVVTAPALTSSFSPATLTIARGSGGTGTLLLNPVGGYSGTVTVSCGALPAHFLCNPVPSTVVLSGNNAQQSVSVYIDDSTTLGSTTPMHIGASRFPEALAAFALPCFGLLGLASRRRRYGQKGFALLLLLVGLTGVATLGTTGCGNSANNNSAPSGSYTIHVNVAANGTTVTGSDLAVVVQ